MPLSLIQPQRLPETAENRKRRLRGFADRINWDGVAGWAYDPDSPETRVTLEIVDNDEVIDTILADRLREGLAAHGIGDGRHSFEAKYPSPLSPLIRHVVRIRRQSDKHELERSGVVLEPAPERVRPVSEFKFHIDHPSVIDGCAELPGHGGLFVEGWAIADAAIEAVEVLLDGASLGHATHGLPRKGVREAFPERPHALRSGFAFVAPRRPAPGRHQVALAIRDAGGITHRAEFALEVLPATREPAAWSLRRHVPTAELTLKTAVLDRAGFRPRFLVLLRIENDSPATLDGARDTLASLARQVYPAWRLALLLPEGGLAEPVLDGFADLADSIVAIDAIDAALSGSAEERADYIVPLRAGDTLGADALIELALAAAARRDAEFLYSDERRLDPASETVGPFFKPDWSPELLLSTNYIGRFWAASAGLICRAFGSARRLSETGNYDSVLRLTEAAAAIEHVPLVLCERGSERREVEEQERAALAAAAARRGIDAEVEPGCLRGTYRLKRPVGQGPLVSIVMPTAGTRGLFKTAISSLRAFTRYRNFEIVLVENIPAEDAAAKEWASDNADAIVSTAGPFNWSRFNNLGAAQAGGEYLLFLNDDIEVIAPDWLEALLEHAARPEIGIVGPQLLYPDRTVQHAGMFLSEAGGRHAFRFFRQEEPGPFGLALTQRDVIAVTGACMLMRHDTFAALGGFDEAHELINNDLDFCLRAHEAGLRTVFTPHSTLVHHEKASRALLDEDRNSARFQEAWGERLAAGDPFFSPHLAKSGDDYAPEPEPVELVYPSLPLAFPAAVRRILVLKLDEIGDFVTALPALRRLKRHFPAAELTLVAPEATCDLAGLEPGIYWIIPWHGGRREAEPGELRRQLRSYRFDLAIDMRRQPETRSLLRQSGARWLAGFDIGGRFPWLDVAAIWAGDVARSGKQVHVGDDMLRLVDAVEAAFDDPSPSSRLAPIEARRRLAERSEIAEILAGWEGERIVGIHPGAGAENRQWPAEHFAALIDRLAAEEGMRVLLVGAPGDEALARAVLDAVGRRDAVRSLVGRTETADLPLVVQACDLFVGNNSGPQHIAAALGVATVNVHSGVVDPREWGPAGPNAVSVRRAMSCSPCYLAGASDCHRGLACLRQLTPADVFRACHTLLRASAATA